MRHIAEVGQLPSSGPQVGQNARPCGRLLGNFAYMIGPMDACPNGGVQWRQDLTPFLQSRGVIVLDPTRKPMSIGDESPEERAKWRQHKADGDYEGLSKRVREIRGVDLRMVQLSHFVIALWDLDIPMTGTTEEVFWANRLKLPTLIVCKQGRGRAPDWLYGTVPPDHIFGTFDDLKAYLDHVDTADEVETYGRWVFFDQQKLYTPTVLERLLHMHAGVDASTPQDAVGEQSDLSLPPSV
jgi:hypothetical protein